MKFITHNLCNYIGSKFIFLHYPLKSILSIKKNAEKYTPMVLKSCDRQIPKCTYDIYTDDTVQLSNLYFPWLIFHFMEKNNIDLSDPP